MKPIIKIKKLKTYATTPTKGSDYSAGYDLYSCEDKIIEPYKTEKISTGIAMELPQGYFGGIYARSGLATKQGLRPSNCTGIIDSDYRGECIVALYNDSDETRKIFSGDRIAQLIIQDYLDFDFMEVEQLDDTERGMNGFGSTGIK